MNDREDSPAQRYHFIVPVWGAKYVAMFVDYSLPSQLSSGNLPALPPGMTTYEIFTTADDIETIENAASVKQLRAVAQVEIKTFTDKEVLRDLALTDHTYVKNLQKMTWCYQQAVNACRGIDAAFVFMTPDSIWGNGAFRYMHECQSSGVRALMALGLITVRPLVQERLAEFTGPDPSIIDIPPRQLVTLACDALHPLGISRIVKDGSARWNSAFYWMKPGQGMVARCFYLHPIMVRPRVHLERMPSTVDYRYVQQACPDFGDVQIVTDSDDLFYIDMADLSHAGDALNLEKFTPEQIVDWMCEWTDAYHQAYFAQPILVHENEIGASFQTATEQSARFANALLAKYTEIYPTCGKTVFASNVFRSAGDEPDPSSLAKKGVLAKILRKIRRLPFRIIALPRRAVRFAYRCLFGKLLHRMQHLENVLAHNRSVQDGWKPYLIRAEYEMQREMDILRARLENPDKEVITLHGTTAAKRKHI